jgi:hypothetical protein
LTNVIVLPDGMFVPEMLKPVSAAVKFAVADVSVVDAAVVTPSATDRAIALSTLIAESAGMDAVVARLNVTTQPPLTDFTNVLGAIPAGPPADRFTKPVAAVQFTAVNEVAPDGMVAVGCKVRAAPLCQTAFAKS